MPPRLSAITLAAAALTGCASPNNYDYNSNPFDEPVAIVKKRVDPNPLLPRTPAVGKVDSSGMPRQETADTSVAQAFPVAPAQSLEVSPAGAGEAAAVQDMINEANRLGSLGDIQGKASLLEQAGYSGSAKAFYDLARMYLDGSMPTDMSQAFKYITLSHEDGFAEATRVLGMLYLRGQGVAPDQSYGRKLLEQASKVSARAAREYGQLLTNQIQPHLNDTELGIQYLRDAADRGDHDAASSLAKELAKAGDVAGAQFYSNSGATEASEKPHTVSLQDRALRGDAEAMFQYAQQVMLRRIKAPEPEFTAYCWLSVADQLGSPQAAAELSLIRGVRAISEKKQPGRLDQCIRDLHYQVSGRI